ncbi:MAG: hypothetical protein ACT4QC_04915 [Planctomycetaceae bacterium]
MRRPFRMIVGLLLLVTCGPRLLFAENPLDAVSTDAGIVIRLKSPADTREKVSAWLKEVEPGIGDQFQSLTAEAGKLILNPTLGGVDPAADWWVAMYPRPASQRPGVVFLIPALDLKQMRQSAGAPDRFMEFGKFGVYSKDADASDRTAARIKGEGKSISALIEADSAALFDQGDVSVFIHVPRLVAVHREDLEELKEQVAQGLDNLPGAPGMNTSAFGDVLRELMELVSRGLDDAQSCTIAATFSKEGVYFEDLVRVAADSQSDKLLQNRPPGTLALLKSMPAGALGYLGLFGDFFGLTDLGARFAGNPAQGEKGQQAKAALDELKKLKYGATASSFVLGALKDGALRTVSISDLDQPAKLRELTNKMIKAQGKIETGATVKASSEVKEAGEQFGEVAADVVKVTLAAGDDAEPFAAEIIGRFTEGVYGPEGMVSRLVYLPDKAVQTTGGGKAAMQSVLDALSGKQPPAGEQPAFKGVYDRLGEKANLMVLFDLPGTIGQVIRIVAESGALPFVPVNAEMVQGLDLKPSFIGLSLAAEPRGLRVRTLISTEQARGVAKLVEMVLQMQAGFGPPVQ